MKPVFLEKILAAKRLEVAEMPLENLLPKQASGMSFLDQLKSHPERIQLIAEVKRASPSKGAIKLDVDPATQAKAYQEAGAAMISVLTDPQFFKGSIEDLAAVTKAVSIPVLCKDFIISEKQMIRARNRGASAILLIVAALSEEKLETLYQKAADLELLVLLEVHNEAELRIAERLNAPLIGINNRDLRTFKTDISVSERLAVKRDKRDRFYVSESGFATSQDVARVSKIIMQFSLGKR
ncbi:indole-3-glycerol-phosphate synthase [Listeria floridensis FSL S10-1187]|uniref:indole-3-glycerol-phosphate synthase n=1 Tax=Listeria floridensis FSL S10-1187 TaxID=1265817 RepID=A0ABP3B1D9_9LIST|nr:indole-3-glycerol-phosphate synthase [Listeria floridensis FSL S10-1187]